MKNYSVLLFSILILFGCKTQEDRIKDFAFAEINALLVAPETSEFTNVKIYKEGNGYFTVCGFQSSKNSLGVRGLNERFIVNLDPREDTFKLSFLALDRRGRPSLQLVDTSVNGDVGKVVVVEDLEQWAENLCDKTEKEFKDKKTK